MMDVLLVDDSRLSRMTVKKCLEQKISDWTFIEASNGMEALSLFEEHPVDHAVLDYNMPEIDGIELAVKLQEKNKNIKIAIVTANMQEYLREEAKKINCIMVGKPLNDTTTGGILEFFEG